MSFQAPVGKKSPQNPASSVAGPANYGDTPVVGIETDYARSDHNHGLPAATGGSGTPSATVTGPDAFGASSVVGVQNTFSRGDHDHGLPSLPFIPAASSTVSGPPSYGSSPVVGVATAYSRGDHSHGLPASSGSPATTVTGPDAYGAPAVVGTSLLFARADHDHGLPGASGGTPASSVTGPDAFGASSVVGVSPNYARQDHDHGLPSLPSIPSPATSVVGPGAYSSSPVIGTSLLYARQDHFHGLPAAGSGAFADPTIFYVSQYGAVGNNSTDDTVAIQNCLDAGGANSIIIFDRKNYKITTKLKVYQGQQLIGRGGLFAVTPGTQLTFWGASGTMMSSTNTAAICYNFRMSNIRFNGGGTADICLDMNGMQLSEIDACYFANNKTGCKGISLNNTQGFTYFNQITRCQTSITGTSAIGLFFSNGANSNYVYGHKSSGDNISVWFDTASELNKFFGFESENDTGPYCVYIDAAFNQFYGPHIENVAIGFNLTGNNAQGTIIQGFTYATITTPISGNTGLTVSDRSVMPVMLMQGAIQIYAGTGSPNGAVTANAGCLYLRIDGGTSTSLYVKESNGSSSGWVAK